VVVYTSVDEVFARPIAERFERSTGVRVRLVPDTEETKSTGLVNRLIAEKERPRADVFWSGDPVRAAILKERGVAAAYHPPQAEGLPERYSDPEGFWTGFSARARVLIYNRDLVGVGEGKAAKPESLMDLLDGRFEGEACMANPLFGTTSMHAAALFAVLGEDEARQFFEGFVANGGRILSSNGEVRRRVAAGVCAVGITDSDDYNVARIEGKPVGVVYPDSGGMGTLVIPNAALRIAGGPNPEPAEQFINFLLTPEIEQALAESQAAQMPVRPSVPIPDGVRSLESITPMRVDYMELAPILERISRSYLKEWVDRNLQ
jgi:iron(III) transport system substrate-binding protein